MLEQLRRFLRRKKGGPKRPLELTVADQWVLKFLFLVRDKSVSEEDLVAAVLEERPTLIPHEVTAAVQKLHLVGALIQDVQGKYQVAPKAKKIKDILPERPGVNMDYYG